MGGEVRHPIDRIIWVHANTLIANDYNPNIIQGAEMTLLEHNLIVLGWTQPILTRADNAPEIVDGFHRATLAKTSAALHKRDGGMVPISALNVSRQQAIVITVRMNRARGTHMALKMSELVQELIDDHGLSMAAVGKEIGANLDEIKLLYAGGVFKARGLEGREYSRAWEPREDGRHSNEVYKK
jgi:ParB-like chromosome segregation protein Spo0J